MARYSTLIAALITTATALHGIVVPTNISAETPFQATFEDANKDSYRVFLAASAVGVIGWLVNSTTLTTPLDLKIPASVGPDALYYSIGIADLTTNQGATYSNKFALTAANGTPTQYEEHLQGAPFWDANNLPCASMSCARQCANQSYPKDLKAGPEFATMRNCIFACPGVAEDAPPSRVPSALATSSGAAATSSESIVTTDTSTTTNTVTASAVATAHGPQSETSLDVPSSTDDATATATTPETTTTATSEAPTAYPTVSNSEGVGTRWAEPLLMAVGMAGAAALMLN